MVKREIVRMKVKDEGEESEVEGTRIEICKKEEGTPDQLMP